MDQLRKDLDACRADQHLAFKTSELIECRNANARLLADNARLSEGNAFDKNQLTKSEAQLDKAKTDFRRVSELKDHCMQAVDTCQDLRAKCDKTVRQLSMKNPCIFF